MAEFLEIKLPLRASKDYAIATKINNDVDALLSKLATFIDDNLENIDNPEYSEDNFDLENHPDFDDFDKGIREIIVEDVAEPSVSFITEPKRKPPPRPSIRARRSKELKESSSKVLPTVQYQRPVTRQSVMKNKTNSLPSDDDGSKMADARQTPSPLPSATFGGTASVKHGSHQTPVSSKAINSQTRVPVLSASKTRPAIPAAPQTESSKGHLPRLAKSGTSSATKISGSALKKRMDEENERVARLQQQLKEKEEKALQQKEQFLQNKVMQNKMKREEKERKVQMTREQLEREANERRLRESAKKRDADKKKRELEDQRKILLKKGEDKADAERKAADELAKKELAKRLEEEQRNEIRLKIQQLQISKASNSSLGGTRLGQTSLLATSMSTSMLGTASKPATNTSVFTNGGMTTPAAPLASTMQPVPPSTTSLMSDDARSPPVPPTTAANATFSLAKETANSTFNVPKEPPKTITSIDISDLNSGEDSDDEKTNKNFASWSKGTEFMESLKAQFIKKKKYRDIDIIKIFGRCPTTVDLNEIFANYPRKVIPRYEKRTSSAIWSSPPSSKFSDSFWANASFTKSMWEKSDQE